MNVTTTALVALISIIEENDNVIAKLKQRNSALKGKNKSLKIEGDQEQGDLKWAIEDLKSDLAKVDKERVKVDTDRAELINFVIDDIVPFIDNMRRLYDHLDEEGGDYVNVFCSDIEEKLNALKVNLPIVKNHD